MLDARHVKILRWCLPFTEVLPVCTDVEFDVCGICVRLSTLSESTREMDTRRTSLLLTRCPLGIEWKHRTVELERLGFFCCLPKICTFFGDDTSHVAAADTCCNSGTKPGGFQERVHYNNPTHWPTGSVCVVFYCWVMKLLIETILLCRERA